MLLTKCLTDCTFFFLQELESIAAKRVVESLASRSELGQIRTRLQDLEDSRNKWMKKAQARGKMLQDLCTVVKRYIQDVEAEKEGAKPIIITRSVGLQVVDSAAAKKVSHIVHFYDAICLYNFYLIHLVRPFFCLFFSRPIKTDKAIEFCPNP